MAEQASASVAVADWSRQAEEARTQGHAVPPTPPIIEPVDTAVRLDSNQSDEPPVSLLSPGQSLLWYFKTHEGSVGILQIVGPTDDPPGVKIRYKLATPRKAL
jgi:hypothetical protein